LIVKTSLIFGKRFTVLKTVNRFLKLDSLSLHARLIFDCPNPIIVGRPKLGGIGIRHLATGIMPTPESGDIRPSSPDAGGPDSDKIWPEFGHDQNRPDLAKMAGIRLDITVPYY
jgi:hypothetical protein